MSSLESAVTGHGSGAPNVCEFLATKRAPTSGVLVRLLGSVTSNLHLIQLGTGISMVQDPRLPASAREHFTDSSWFCSTFDMAQFKRPFPRVTLG